MWAFCRYNDVRTLTFPGAFQATLAGKPITNYYTARMQDLLVYLALDTLFEPAARSLAQADFHMAQSVAHHQPALEPWRKKARRQ